MTPGEKIADWWENSADPGASETADHAARIDAAIAEAVAAERERSCQWIKPPWRDRKDDEDGWPWVDDHFLAAVQLVDGPNGKPRWDFSVLHWTESGLETTDGECWSAWSESDIEWISRIPAPPAT